MRWILLLTPGCTLSVDDFDLDGWSVADGDCDDLDAAVHPQAADNASDRIDQDCDGHDVIGADAGDQHRCELLDDGTVSCIGDNSDGQLDVPAEASDFVALAAGDNHTCALDLQGVVWCWGDDSYGQSTPPRPDGFADIDADDNYSLAHVIGEEGRAPLCWGDCPHVMQQAR
jgi:alpha-tubulin suppressor-like RCC1 family protein